jgi:hypothetical protein
VPDYKAAIKKVREEQPDVAQIPIEPAGFLGRILGGRNEAVTNPFTGSVSYNPANMEKLSPEQTENIFAHELTHSRQVQNTPYFSRLTNVMRSMIPGQDESYYQRPREMEAFQTERDRNLRYGYSQPDPITQARDIELPPVSPRRKMMAMFTNDRNR